LNLSLLAADIHVTLKATELFKLGPLAVTNSILYGIICSIFIAGLFIAAARRISVHPGKGLFMGTVESIVEYVINLLQGPFGTRERAARFTPIFGVYFIFILFTNLLELVPWVGEMLYKDVGGIRQAVLRPFTADLNGTLAMAVIAIIMVQILSIREQGVKKHLQHYFSDKPKNPLNLFIGLLEVFGEFTRIISLSLRLFLNTAVGEILITVFTSMILAEGRTPFAVIPIFLFEGLVAYIQAYVFMVLCGTYLGMAIAHADAHHDHDHLADLSEGVDSRGMIGG